MAVLCGFLIILGIACIIVAVIAAAEDEGKLFVGFATTAVLLMIGGFYGMSFVPPDSTANNLPEKARNIRPIGNDWTTFDLEIDGQTRKFLYHRRSSAESIVEVSQ